jgi:formate dehydrogenase subunit gamma
MLKRICHPYARLDRAVMIVALVVAGLFALSQSADAQSSVRPPANAVGNAAPGAVPPNADNKASNYDIEMWRRIRGGVEGQVTIPDKKAGVLVQSGGETWRNFRNGPLPRYGAYAMGGMITLLALFYLVRGRIRIEHGPAGRTIERFTDLERMGHWLMAASFIILGLSGLNILYGRYVLLPVIGKDAFAGLSILAKWLHNYVAFAFMAGLLLTFVMWVRHNFPNMYDVKWLLAGGGLFSKGAHPPAKKFNAGQKVLFWLIMLGGLSISMSGLAMMFPFQTAMFSKTFGFLGMLGISVPAGATPIQEMQFATAWHAIMGLFLITVIIAHIYIGSVGMEGAFDAMGSGQVDVNWAKEHHSIWADEELARLGTAQTVTGQHARPQPAE